MVLLKDFSFQVLTDDIADKDKLIDSLFDIDCLPSKTSTGNSSCSKTDLKCGTSEKQTDVGQPIETQPVEKQKEVGQAVETHKEVGQPIETQTEVGQPIETQNEVGQPIETQSEVGQPIEKQNEVAQPTEIHNKIGEPALNCLIIQSMISEKKQTDCEKDLKDCEEKLANLDISTPTNPINTESEVIKKPNKKDNKKTPKSHESVAERLKKQQKAERNNTPKKYTTLGEYMSENCKNHAVRKLSFDEGEKGGSKETDEMKRAMEKFPLKYVLRTGKVCLY